MKGWFKDSARHSMAAKGIKTGKTLKLKKATSWGKPSEMTDKTLIDEYLMYKDVISGPRSVKDVQWFYELQDELIRRGLL